MKTVKSIIGIKETAFVNRTQVLLDVSPCQSRSAKNDGWKYLALIHYLKIFLHDESRFHQQARHPDCVCLVLIQRREHSFQRTLNSEIHNFVSIIGKDNIDKILTNIMDIAFDCRNDHRPL